MGYHNIMRAELLIKTPYSFHALVEAIAVFNNLKWNCGQFQYAGAKTKGLFVLDIRPEKPELVNGQPQSYQHVDIYQLADHLGAPVSPPVLLSRIHL